MNLQDCIKFTNTNPICSLATVEKDQPRVRMIGFWYADETGFYFQTSGSKSIPKQLRENPKVEACFYKHEGMIGTMLRIAGSIEFIEDTKLREQAIIDRPFLKSFGLSADSPELILFNIAHGEAHFWNMENNMKPKTMITF